MLNNFELYDVHAERTEIEEWPILNTKVDYVEYNRNNMSSNRAKYRPTEGKCQKFV